MKDSPNKAEKLSEALCYLPVDGSGGNHAGVESGLSGPALPELGPNRAPHLAAVPHVAKLAHRACNKKYEVMRIRVKFQSFTSRINVIKLRIECYNWQDPLMSNDPFRQCFGSGMFIPDPTFFHPGSRIRLFPISQRYGSGSEPKCHRSPTLATLIFSGCQ